MAIVQCPECKKDVSTTTTQCPHCGFVGEPGSANYERRRAAAGSPSAGRPKASTGRSVLAGAMALVVVGIGFAAAKSCSDVVHETKASAVAAGASSPNPSTPPAPDANPSAQRSMAMFTDDDLDECFEATVEWQSSEPPPSNWPEHAAAAFDALFKRVKGATALARSCSEQFSDRKPFGTCSIFIDAKGNKVAFRDKHYRFKPVFRSDVAMKECLQAGGKWEAMPRDSMEFVDAQMRYDLEDMRRRHEKAEKQLRRLAAEVE